MIVSVLQESLTKGLGIVGPAVNAKSTVPVLGNVLLATDDGHLKLSATNLEIGIVCWIAANVTEGGGVTLPARTLGDLVAALPRGERVDMVLTQRTQSLNLESGRTSANIKGIDMHEFPIVHGPDQKEYAAIDAKQFGTAIRQVAVAAATDESRPILTGVLMKFEGGQLTLAAADGHRMAVRSIPAPRYSGDPFSIILPATALRHVARLCKESETVELYRGKKRQQVTFQFGDIVLTSQLIDGNFPDYRQIIPNGYHTKTEVSTADFLKACKAARIFARDSAHISRLCVKPGDGGVPGTITLSSTSVETGDNKNEITAEVQGDEIEVAFDIRYLIDLLSNIKTPKLVLETTHYASPGAFRPVGDEDYVHVLMPMHLTSSQAPPIADANA
ncbi:MAG: DNA polymerase III subunit beta [Chloroflexi bacterium]|nr:DNA polymerase III subunit beta [Chloroflexota bacterium]